MALRPETPVEAAAHLFDAVDGCLLLTAPPGGGPFDERAVRKFFDLPAYLPTIVDGRIDESHFALLRAADVTDVVIGQALFGASDVGARAAVLARMMAEEPVPAGERRRLGPPRI